MEEKLILIIVDKLIIGFFAIIIGYWIKKTIEKSKSEQSFSNEIAKMRLEKIARFYELFSEYEHWVNRIILNIHSINTQKKEYLSEEDFFEASEKADNLAKTIGYELNKMRFWINDDIYYHTTAQLEFFKKVKEDLIIKQDYDLADEHRKNLDIIRMNIDKLVIYLKNKPKIEITRYNKSILYKKSRKNYNA